MAWTGTNPVSIGDATKKAHYDALWDNVDLLYDALADITFTAGDILYASSTTVLARLPKGTAAQTLKMNAGATAPEWV